MSLRDKQRFVFISFAISIYTFHVLSAESNSILFVRLFCTFIVPLIQPVSSHIFLLYFLEIITSDLSAFFLVIFHFYLFFSLFSF